MISVPWSGTVPFGVSDFEPDAKRRYTGGATNALVRGEELRCCIRGCNRWIARRRRGASAEYCPDHHISISISPTYVFQDWRSNFIVNPAPISGMSKVETWRLGNESSEDALSWNVFVPLLHMDLLPALLEQLDLDRTMSEVELYLWGNRILKAPGSKGLWDHLSRARKVLERGVGFPTEPDIILRVPGRLLVLIEAKFGSSNATLFHKEDRFGGVDEFLARYPAAEGIEDPIDRKWIEEQAPECVLEQLVRNVVFATHLAEKDERMIVLNLVRESDEITVESKFRKHLIPQGCVEFRRITWESFWPIFVRGGDNATPVLNYLANKSLGLGTAFPSLSCSAVTSD
jgi:hypothetical protein